MILYGFATGLVNIIISFLITLKLLITYDASDRCLDQLSVTNFAIMGLRGVVTTTFIIAYFDQDEMCNERKQWLCAAFITIHEYCDVITCEYSMYIVHTSSISNQLPPAQ